MQHIVVAVVAILTAASAVACIPQGDGGDGEPDPNFEPRLDAAVGSGGPRVGGEVDYPPGVDDADSIDSLDPEDRQATCDALEATYANALSEEDGQAFACGLQAIFVGFASDDPQAECQTAFDTCLASPPPEMDPPGEDEPCPLLEQPECTATLGELEACIQFGLGAVLAFNAAFDCAEIADAFDMTPDEEPDEETPCDIIDRKCPGLLDDDTPEDNVDATDPAP